MSSDEPRFVDNDSEQRRELWEGDELVGWADYRDAGQARALTHVHVSQERRGEGVGGRIVREFLKWTSQQGMRTLPACGYAASWVREHPEVADQVTSA